MEQDIKILISCHKEYYVPKHPFLYPIQVGADFGHKLFQDMRQDNTGENISFLNRRYCELTALYWAWKNESADYYGLFHYRRYFSFIESGKRPYMILTKPDNSTLLSHGFEPKNMSEVINKFDVIVPVPEKMFISAYNQYKQSKNHHIEDLEMIRDIIKDIYPCYKNAVQKYFESKALFFGNMSIMKKDIFNDYCKWLFGILHEFDKRKDFSKYDSKEMRVNGYLGERLLGIYCTWLKQNSNIKIGYLPRLHFEAFPGETDNFRQMKRIYRILPPGTMRRSIVKKLFKKLG